MVKLVRNTWGRHKTLYDQENNKIEWKYVNKLYEYTVTKKLTSYHKITKEHIHYEKNKMKVKLAVQVLSNSVADSIEKLMNDGYEDFQGAEATVKFIRKFNRLFDVMKLRHRH